MIKTVVKKSIPVRLWPLWRKLKTSFLDGYALKSYSQDGEDLVLRQFFKKQQSGFYVDVGAHHPKRFSNTWFFYKKGWQGINIDATPGSMQPFLKARPRDINIEAAVADEQQELKFFMFNESALNSFDEALSYQRQQKNPRLRIIETKKIITQRLETILDNHLPTGQQIDFLSVDVEGFDLAVLRSNDWRRFRPRYLLVETMTVLNDITQDPVYQFLTTNNFVLVAKTLRTAIFKDNTPDE